MTRYSVDCSHIDTCLPCYLTDHHNRDGELLLSVPVDNTTTYGEIAEALRSELNAADWGMPDDITEDDTEHAFDDCIPASIYDSVFDASLDARDDDDTGERCAAHFLLKWEEADDEDEPVSVRCDQCEAVMINGVFCHETGCPNTGARYDAEEECWVPQRECRECGNTVDRGEPCCEEC